MPAPARLQDTLDAYLQSRAGFEEVSQELAQALAAPERDTPAILELLHKGREAGMQHHVYVALRSLVESAAARRVPPPTRPPPGGEGAGPTAPPAFDATVKLDQPLRLRAPAAAQHPGAEPTALRARPEDTSTTSITAQDEEPTDVREHAETAGPTVSGPSVEEPGATRRVTPDTTPSGPATTGAAIDLQADAVQGGGTAPERNTGASWPTDTQWGPRAGRPQRQITTGTVLKDRFELVQKLGEGGMGQVWKALDRLKEEARDRHPFIAVKLLSGDFQRHPESFIALQRESAKAQRLAHPNIATVFDFDRDGTTIYMTMELLEGEALNHFIKKLPDGGLPVEEAMRLIEQLCAGLSYAHKHNLVHSDLKPGNCWITKDGTAKLLDFGIARASKARSEEVGETTVFDPGQLGALTPAYATIEMFEGQDPDPRDDIYALACISYELLAGRHPFNKTSAPKALEGGLVPAPIPKLGKRQNRGLLHALALRRAERTPTVDQFLEDIRPRKSRTLQYVASALVAIAVIAALAYKPVQDHLDGRQIAQIVASLEGASDDVVLSTLEALKARPPAIRDGVIEAAKERLVDFYEARAERAIDATNQRYDFPLALAQIEAAKRLYPDSATLQRIESDIESRRNRLLNELDERYNRYLEQGRLLPLADQEDITDALAVIAKADPKHPLLRDPRLPVRYAEEAERAMARQDLAQADALLQASMAYAPGDSRLGGLRYQVQEALRRVEEEGLVAQTQQRLEQERPALKSLADFAAVRDELVRLAELRPDSPVLAGLQAALRKALAAELQRLTAARSWEPAEDALAGFAPVLDLGYLIEQRHGLSTAQAGAGYRRPAARAATAERRRAEVGQLLASPRPGGSWDNALLLAFKQLAAVVPDGDLLGPLQARAADIYLERARQLRAESRFVEALAYIRHGEELAPGRPELAAVRAAIAGAESAFRREQAEKARLARLEGLKQTLLTQANADRVQEARRTLDELRAGLAPDDPALQEGAAAIAGAYLRLAEGQAAGGRHQEALKLARAGLELAPELPALRAAVERYGMEVRLQALRASVEKGERLEAGSLRRELGALREAFPERYPALEEEVVGLLEARIRALEAKDPGRAGELLALAREVFPGHTALARIRLKEPPRPCELCPQAGEAVNQGRLTAAEGLLAQAQKAQPDHPDIARLRQTLSTRKDQAESAYAQAQRARQLNQRTQAATLYRQAQSLWSDNPGLAPPEPAAPARPGSCTRQLVGLGADRRAVCYDMLSEKERGPAMVVIPAGGGSAVPYAISKYEISVDDFNTYCRRSGKCPPLAAGSGDLPATGVSARQAEAYAGWLSDTTGHRYRLPREGEWVHAATAQGQAAQKDFNCRVKLGDQLLKGHALLGVRSGNANPWGLVNHVGNAQEWVRGSGGLVARGGSFQDSLSTCEIGLARPHSGEPDAVTGFRLVMELG
jgi:serine/threonine protein kinase